MRELAQAREILSYPKCPVALHCPDTYGVVLRAENDCAVRLRVHKVLVGRFGALVKRDGFPIGVETQAAERQPLAENRLAGQLMREGLPRSHELGMCPRGLLQFCVLLKGWQPLLRPCLVNQLDQLLLGRCVVAIRCRGGATRHGDDKHRYRAEQSTRPYHGNLDDACG